MSAITPGMDLAWFVDSVIVNVITPVGQLFFALAVFYLLWNILEAVRKSDQAEEREKLKEKVLWGVIAITVMVSLLGLVYILTNTFGWAGNASPTEIRVIGL